MTNHAEQGQKTHDSTIEQLEHFKKLMEPTPSERCLYEDDWDGLMVVNDDGTVAGQLTEILEENDE